MNIRFDLKSVLVFFVISGFFIAGLSGVETVAQLKEELKRTTAPKKKVNVLNKMAELAIGQSAKESIEYVKQAAALAKENNDTAGEGSSLRNIGYELA
ncbi:MAG: hypothetical protein GY757_25770, partial [bacterium]|nr:hypothetical protein [bacterium]